LSKLVTGTLENLNLAVNLKKKILQKYGSVVIFYLYGNKNVPSAEILRGQHCLRTRTFISFGLSKILTKSGIFEKNLSTIICCKVFGLAEEIKKFPTIIKKN
jgi:hypothetical protein